MANQQGADIAVARNQMQGATRYTGGVQQLNRPKSDSQLNRSTQQFQIGPDFLIVGHFTGDRFYDRARLALGEKVIHSAVGTRLVFGASEDVAS